MPLAVIMEAGRRSSRAERRSSCWGIIKGVALNYKKYDSDRSIRHTRKSLRLPTHNYAWTGSYFVTICAKERGPLFETLELRTILTETWHDLPNRFPGLTLDEFVVMPDHVHFILHLQGNVEKPPTLGQVIGAYKSITTVAWLRHIEATGMNCSGRFWQANYFERILRNIDELEEKREYTRNNPLKLKKAPKTDEL